MKKIYALFMTLCLVISATAAPLVGTAKKSYPLYPQEVVKAKLSFDLIERVKNNKDGKEFNGNTFVVVTCVAAIKLLATKVFVLGL